MQHARPSVALPVVSVTLAKPQLWLRVNRAGLVCSAVFAMLYSALALYRYSHFVWSSWDLGIFTQVVSSYAHLEAPTVPIRGVGFNALGDHFSPALAVLAVPYALVPDPATLLVAQALLLAWSIFPDPSAGDASPRVRAGSRGHHRLRRVLRRRASGSRRLPRGRPRRTPDGLRRRRTRGAAMAPGGPRFAAPGPGEGGPGRDGGRDRPRVRHSRPRPARRAAGGIRPDRERGRDLLSHSCTVEHGQLRLLRPARRLRRRHSLPVRCAEPRRSAGVAAARRSGPC